MLLTVPKLGDHISGAKLAADVPCIVVRSPWELTEETSIGLLALKPDHCEIAGIHVYTVGLACAKVQGEFAAGR